VWNKIPTFDDFFFLQHMTRNIYMHNFFFVKMGKDVRLRYDVNHEVNEGVIYLGCTTRKHNWQIFGNVLNMVALPLHLFRQASILLPSSRYNPTRVLTYFLKGLHLSMIIIEAEYDIVNRQTIKDAIVGPW